MQKHLESCNRTVTTTSTDPDVIEIPSTTLGPSNAKQQRIDSFVSNTSAQERDQLNVLVARFFIATNTPFNRVEHPTFLALLSALRSSYRPPNRHVLAEEFRHCNGCSPQRLVETCQGPRGDIKNLSKDFGLLAVYWISGKTFQHIRLGSLEGTKQTGD